MITIQASVSKGWLHKNGGFSFNEEYYMDPFFSQNQDKIMHEFIKKRFPDYQIYFMEANLVQAPYVDKNQILVGAFQPNLILATVLGSKIVYYPDKDPDIETVPLRDISTPQDLPDIRDVMNYPLIKTLDHQIKSIKSAYPELVVIPPFFWDTSGRATIHGIITTSLKLLGDKVMTLTMLDPGLLHQIHQWITDTYIALIRHYSQICDFPVNSVHVGECSGIMISSDQYLEFIIPYINQLGKELGDIRLHSCGKSDYLLDVISKIEDLKIIDVSSDTSVKMIRSIFGKQFDINLSPPVELLLKGSSKETLHEWLNKSLEENQGGPIQFAYHMEEDYDYENCLSIHDKLEEQKLITKGRLY
ncbi:MAG: hypothetical protein K8R35_08860 [Bacteroidales bacterium]|nr:hypothetical protein [Bacteroidales bacterium]